MAQWEPGSSVSVPAVQQEWRALTFIHHGYEPGAIAQLLPDGLEPDVHDGLAWVGITPFQMAASVAPIAPGPRVNVGEVNVRTYARRPSGTDGLWFLSLDLSQALVARAIRTTLGLPYRTATISVQQTGARVHYTMQRQEGERASLDLEVEVGELIAESELSELDVFLTGRWRAFTQRLGRLMHVPVEHPPWTLHRASILACEHNGLLRGLPAPRTEAHVLYSPGVEVKLGFPRP